MGIVARGHITSYRHVRTTLQRTSSDVIMAVNGLTVYHSCVYVLRARVCLCVCVCVCFSVPTYSPCFYLFVPVSVHNDKT